MSNRDLLHPTDSFARRHIGPTDAEKATMLAKIGIDSLDTLIDQTVPAHIRYHHALDVPEALGEAAALADMEALAKANKVYRSYIGMGYSGTITPPVVLRNVLEDPGWYTQYTPYQAEIAQGRLEALLNFQTLISDLTGMEIANASMLDEATAAAEAMTLAHRAMPRKSTKNSFFVSDQVHPQTIEVVRTRAEPLDLKVVVGNHADFTFDDNTFGALIQYPNSEGDVEDYGPFCDAAHQAGALVVAAADLLALTLLREPAAFGVDITVGNSQRFGVPMGYGGPHAGYMATREEYKRMLPGRLVGVSVDVTGAPAMRLALQTREQHIRRASATSNICTAQVLLAIMASMYAVYHGPAGLKKIAQRVALMTQILANGLESMGYTINSSPVFDTLTVKKGPRTQAEIAAAAEAKQINLRLYDNGNVGVSLDETVNAADLQDLFAVFGATESFDIAALADAASIAYDDTHTRSSDYLTHPTFNSYHSETEMLRYIQRLRNRDLSLAHSMISLGSCTMKLNATTEMIPVTWPGFGQLHPFAPIEQAQGYQEMFRRLEAYLEAVTGFDKVLLQPNAGSQGEYAGLLSIRNYFLANGDAGRNICLIPSSAHGTNPASAVMAGMKVVVVKCDDAGNVEMDDLRAKAEKHSVNLAALMVTYPSTHGVFESAITEICQLIHDHGGFVYMDGANMNAQVGITSPAHIGADVCHLNLHKTFCIPHGGGGPGMGPIGVVEKLAPHLPGHGQTDLLTKNGAVSAAPWGSSSILPISYAYIRMMGPDGLLEATRVAILNANYIAARLNEHYPVLYKGEEGRVAHECILDLRHLKEHASAEDVAKRLMDYGFHAPTLSFPVVGTLMVEPTESESLAELDRFCDAMIAIRHEIQEIADGVADPVDNVLHHAPHTAPMISADEWTHSYSREKAAYPVAWVAERKFWPYVARIDNVYGDRNLVCACLPMEAYE